MIWEARFGDARLYAIADGWFRIDPLDFLPGSDPDEWARHPEHLDDRGTVRITLGCFLVAGPDPVMVDTGIGPWAPPGHEGEGGRMPAALERLGVAPEDVPAVIHTHLHPDHFGGDLAPDGEPFFPRATYYAHRRELDHWRDVDRVRDRFLPLAEAGRVEPLDGDTEVLPGISAVGTPGHTPGTSRWRSPRPDGTPT